MLKILQAWLQQYVNRELPDVQAGFRKGIPGLEEIFISHISDKDIISRIYIMNSQKSVIGK